ncbi:MAG: hypothetical protein WA864_31860 [Acetobacteraceae bacterium]
MPHDPMSAARCADAARLLVQVSAWAKTAAEDDQAAEDALAASFAAFAATGPTIDYADRICAAAFPAQAEIADGKAAILDAIDRLLDALYQTVVPAELSMFAASIVAHTWFRRGDAEAERLAGAMIAHNVLVPRLRSTAAASNAAIATVVAMALEDLGDRIPFGARPGSRLVALQPEFSRCAELFDTWLHDLVTAGNFALVISAGRPDADPDNVVSQVEAVIASDATLASAFMPPTPDDPLGTAPRYGLTAIGQAIEVAREQRPTDYDWVAVQHLADTSPGEFAALLRDERLHVLDHVRL